MIGWCPLTILKVVILAWLFNNEIKPYYISRNHLSVLEICHLKFQKLNNALFCELKTFQSELFIICSDLSLEDSIQWTVDRPSIFHRLFFVFCFIFFRTTNIVKSGRCLFTNNLIEIAFWKQFWSIFLLRIMTETWAVRRQLNGFVASGTAPGKNINFISIEREKRKKNNKIRKPL